MFENLGLRVFRLSERPSDQGICCNAEGVFVGSVPLLEHLGLNRRAKEQWVVRPQAELNERLALLYEMPVDVAAKIGGIETIARALNEGKLALARIAAVQLGFPNPPARIRTKENPAERVALAAELYWSALLKVDDDWDELHPRTGTKPNPGWFAEKPEDPNLPAKRGWPLPVVNEKLKTWIAERAGEIAMDAGRVLIRAIPVVDAISAFVQT